MEKNNVDDSRTYTNVLDLRNEVGNTVHLRGWVYNTRSSKKVKFLEFRDGTGRVQGVLVDGETSTEAWNTFDGLTQESSIELSGLVKEHPRSELGVELAVSELRVIHLAQDYPITKKEHGPDFLLSHRHLWLRSKRPHAIMRIRDSFLRASREFFYSQGFVNIDAPIFTPNACEGTSTLFETEYFGEKAYLSQSGQLYSEAVAMALGKVYCLGPTFRAEKSKTRRHLTEFWMLEPEAAFMDLNEDMELAENYLSFAIKWVLKECQLELEVLERDTSLLEKVQAPFPRISYDQAIELLKSKGHQVSWGDDFGAPEETALGEHFQKPVIVHRYPKAIKAFYMKDDPENEKTVLAMDVIAPEGYGEIIGGAQREDDLELMLKKIKDHNLDPETFDWYLDLRKYGSVPHAGFGLGVERTLSWICGLTHLRETAAFPRLMQRLRP